MSDHIRIAVIDDHPLYRKGVIDTLLGAPDMVCVGAGATAEDAVRIAMNDAPDIILLDITMPGGGIEAARAIRKACTFVKTVMLTASEDEHHVSEALRSGVSGYILKGSSGAELLQIIRSARNGELYITPALAARLLTQIKQPAVENPGPTDVGALTYREEQVLQLLSLGLMNKEIAHKLHVTEKTVKNYMTEIMQKLNARNRVEAALIARQRNNASDEIPDTSFPPRRQFSMSQ